MIYPTIHLNGTHPQDLLEDQITAMNALREAIRALQAAGPNGRDYYPQGPTAFQNAQEEHSHRVLVLRNLLAEVESIAEYVSKQIK